MLSRCVFRSFVCAGSRPLEVRGRLCVHAFFERNSHKDLCFKAHIDESNLKTYCLSASNFSNGHILLKEICD